MQEFLILWVDAGGNDRFLGKVLSSSYQFKKIGLDEDALATAGNVVSGVLMFDFSFPDQHELGVLKAIREKLPSLPVIVLTQYSSEELVLWALRLHVWDYFVKPVSTECLLRSIECLRSSNLRLVGAMPEHVGLAENVPANVNFSKRKYSYVTTYPAVCYIRNHLGEKISGQLLAKLCGMDRFTFSRNFKKENGQGFRDYLLSERLKKAEQMLLLTDEKITEIALWSGFHDASHFTRLFRRYKSMTPSEFRQGTQ